MKSLDASSAIFDRNVPAHLAMVGYAVLIACAFSFGKIAAPHLDPVVLNAIRFVAATILMGGFLFLQPNSRRRRVPEALWRFLLLGGLMAAYFIFMFMALRITDPVSTSAVFTLVPLMAAVFGYVILAQRVRRIVWLSLCISAVGALWVIFRADFGRLIAFDVGKGEALFFFGCVCQAIYSPLVRKLNRGEGTLEFTVWTIAGCTVSLLIFAAPKLMHMTWSGLGWPVWLSIAYLIVGATAASFFLLQYASMRLPAAKVFPYTYLIPTFVILLEAALGNGWAPMPVFTGAIVTVIGLVILVATPDAG